MNLNLTQKSQNLKFIYKFQSRDLNFEDEFETDLLICFKPIRTETK